MDKLIQIVMNKQTNIKLPSIKRGTEEIKLNPTEINNEFVLYFDGCSKGNPGPSGIGTVIYKNGLEHWCSCKYIGDKRTNNEAEYSALIFGLKEAISQNITHLSVRGDSLLVINQVNEVYKVKQPTLFNLYSTVVELKKKFKLIDFSHVYRKDNKRADQLSNYALNTVNPNHKLLNNIEENYIEEIEEDWEEESDISKFENYTFEDFRTCKNGTK